MERILDCVILCCVTCKCFHLIKVDVVVPGVLVSDVVSSVVVCCKVVTVVISAVVVIGSVVVVIN